MEQEKVTRFELKEDVMLVKHNRLIESKHAQLTMRHKKLIAMLMSQVNIDDDIFKLYEFPAQEICRLLGIDSGSIYEQLKEIAVELAGKTVLVEDKEARAWKIYWFLSKAEYKNGCLYMRLHEDMAPFLLKLYRDYTEYQLSTILELNSGHSITLYEWLKKWSKLKKRSTLLDELRERLGIHEKKSYNNFKDLRKWILEPAVKEINEKTDLLARFEPQKQGKKVVGLTFFIIIKNQTIEPLEHNEQDIQTAEQPKTTKEQLIDDLSPWFHRVKAEALIDEFGEDEERIKAGIAYVLDQQAKGEKIKKSIAGYIYTAILHGKGLKSDLELKEEAEKKAQAEVAKKKQEEEEKRIEEERSLNKKIWEDFLSLTDNIQAIIVQQALNNKPDVIRSIYTNKGHNDPIIKGNIVEYLRKEQEKK